ncbi:hypothetical protein [Streptomyces sp. NPDC046985]|uniref:hypothetical protein n=1 Tax=Streptomyces sp. NPDC046985 TaxID=3155377 RepID=UPI0033C72BA6
MNHTTPNTALRCDRCQAPLASHDKLCPACGHVTTSDVPTPPPLPAHAPSAAPTTPAVPAPGPGPRLAAEAPATRQASPGLVLDLSDHSARPALRLRRPSRRTALIAAATAVALTAGVSAYEITRPAPVTATSTVQKYFSDLARGDVADALALVDPSNAPATGDSPLLVDKALSAASDRPTGLKVVRSTEVGFGGMSETQVEVTYQVHRRTVRQTLGVGKGSAADSRYRLDDPFLGLDLTAAAGRTVTVNGIPVPADAASSPLRVLPGAYTASVPATSLLAAQRATARTDPDSTPDRPRLTADLGKPHLLPGAQALVTTEVRQALDACAASHDGAPKGCPFNALTAVPGEVTAITWSISGYPTLTVTAADPDSMSSDAGEADFSDDGHQGRVHYSAAYDDFGTPAHTTGDLDFDVQGAAASAADGIAVTFQ